MENKEYPHKTRETADKIRAISELEHMRDHCIRAASVSVLKASNSSSDEEKEGHMAEAIKYATWGQEIKELRRKYMRQNFPNIPTEMWCICKAAASLRQVIYETTLGDLDTLRKVDSIVDAIWSDATGEDLSECSTCANDKGETPAEV